MLIVERLIDTETWQQVGMFSCDESVDEFISDQARKNGFYFEDVVQGCDSLGYSYYDVPKVYGTDYYRVKEGDGIYADNEIVKKLVELYEKPHTDSDIRDFCEENSVSMKEAYEFIAALRVPPSCVGCCNNVFYPNMYPCHSCSRIPRKDYFGVEVL